ncbi:site-specific DNA-methyltransferase [Sphingomonas sp. R1]|uniref:site-specific DNA-methyltransferase n=1 Tax=Sphingomonas sp. R1 TaxID=399176 RepID=UPI00222509B1|nr:site-specific DNA-methyltransferase [Sphingomonas sp. R1]UYY77363.1 site-specific DNA-methyltransferase [Sphingomonas sp. R1]
MTDAPRAAGADPIPQITRDDEAAGSGDIRGDNVAQLKALFPEIVTDGQVDFDVLRQLLGDAIEDGEERYGLNWKGKRKARAFALTPSLGTLLPVPDESVNWDSTQNLMIEGDNLEVMKLLRRSYAGQVKLIYIDPPYNTGNDFVYPDSYQDPLSNYLTLTGQSGICGESLTSEREAAGRFHTSWLNMMYPRLLIAKELLRDDGAIFVNIADEEVTNMRKMLDEAFGEDNFVASIIWQKKYAVSADERGLGAMHDYILLYRKSDKFVRGLLPRTAEQDDRYTNIDNDPRGRWASDNYVSNKSREERPTLWYPIRHPKDGREIWPEPHAVWRYTKDKHEELDLDNRLYWGPDQSYEKPRMKRFLSEVQQGIVPSTWWPFQEVGHNDEAQKAVGAMLARKVFSTPKPVRLIDRIITICDDPKAIVMDFFAGSGTTAQAVLEKNAADGANRRYIMVQLPESLDVNDATQRTAAEFCDAIGRPRNIAELTKERLRRAGTKINEENPGAKIDTGFRVYKLSTSNLKPWQPDTEDLELSILDAVENVLPGRTEEDLLVELLLKTGIDLTLPEKKRTIAGKTVHALGGGTLMVCLSDIGADDAETLGQGMADWVEALDPVQTTVYFKDTGLGADGNRAATKANLAAILRQRLGDRIAKIASI